MTSTQSLLNARMLAFTGEIEGPVLVVPGASHVDLYDNPEAIPFDRLAEFFAAAASEGTRSPN